MTERQIPPPMPALARRGVRRANGGFVWRLRPGNSVETLPVEAGKGTRLLVVVRAGSLADAGGMRVPVVVRGGTGPLVRSGGMRVPVVVREGTGPLVWAGGMRVPVVVRGGTGLLVRLGGMWVPDVVCPGAGRLVLCCGKCPPGGLAAAPPGLAPVLLGGGVVSRAGMANLSSGATSTAPLVPSTNGKLSRAMFAV